MDKKLAGLLGAVALTSTPAMAMPAAPNPAPVKAETYADLLEPIPNALALLRADDAARADKQRNGGEVEQGNVQLAGYRHHHHHHHHRYRRGGVRIIIGHHHHHHHRYHHHHHHHHHRDRGY